MWPRLLRCPWRRSASKVARSRIRQPTGPLPLSRGEAVATFTRRRLEDGPPGARGHAVSKPVVLGPFPGVGLVSPLHSLCPFARGRLRRGSSAGAPYEQVPAPSAWPPMLGVSPRPPGRTWPNRDSGAQFHGEFSGRGGGKLPRWARRGTGRHQGVSALLHKVAGHSRTRPTGVGFVATGASPNVPHTTTGSSFPRATRQQAVGGRRTTSRTMPHMWICLWTFWRRDGGGPGERQERLVEALWRHAARAGIRRNVADLAPGPQPRGLRRRPLRAQRAQLAGA